MSTTFRPHAPEQSLLLPPDVREWLPEGHLAHHVSDLVDGLDLTAFYAPYEGDGRRNTPYDPRMMVKVLLYGYATGVFSSRRIARKLEEDVGFRLLAAGNFSQHRTLCEFRRRHLADFQALFVEVVRLAQELGLARFGALGVCGAGPGGEADAVPRPGEVSRDESDGREAVEAGGSCDLRRTQVAVGGPARLDQARAGIPALQPAGAGEGAGRVGPGVPGVERQASARADGGVTHGNVAPDGDRSARITASGGPSGPSAPRFAVRIALGRESASSTNRQRRSATMTQVVDRQPSSRRGISCGADS